MMAATATGKFENTVAVGAPALEKTEPEKKIRKHVALIMRASNCPSPAEKKRNKTPTKKPAKPKQNTVAVEAPALEKPEPERKRKHAANIMRASNWPSPAEKKLKNPARKAAKPKQNTVAVEAPELEMPKPEPVTENAEKRAFTN